MLNKYLDPRHTLTNWTGWTDWTGWLTGLTGLDRLDRLDRLDWLDWLDWQGWCGWQDWQGRQGWQGRYMANLKLWITDRADRAYSRIILPTIAYRLQIWNYHPTDWPTGPLTHGTNCKEMLSHLKRFIFIILNALSVANVVTFLWIAERFFLHILHQLGNAAIALCSREKLLFPQKQFKVRALTNL